MSDQQTDNYPPENSANEVVATVEKIGDEPADETVHAFKKPLNEERRLRFAREILLCLAVIFVLSMIVAFIDPTRGAVIFEACKTVIPSIVTLILGYYFGQK